MIIHKPVLFDGFHYFNSELLRETKYGFLLIGEWRIKRNNDGDYLITPTKIPKIKLSNCNYTGGSLSRHNRCYFTIAYGVASSAEYEGIQLWIREGTEVYLLDRYDNTGVIVNDCEGR